MERKACYTIIVLFFFWLSLASCTYNPLSNKNELTGNPAGAAIGAGVGAGSTALLHAPTPIIWLAGLGGAGIGYYATTLRFESAGIIQAGGQVFILGDYVTIEIPSDNLFDTNSDEFLPGVEPILNSIVTVLKRYPNNDHIIIAGNTSGFSSQKYEQPLSEKRAEQVASYLWANGIKEDSAEVEHKKFIYVGYGDYSPIANHIRAKSIRQNSRIQITSFSSYACHKNNPAFCNIGALNKKPLTVRQVRPCDVSNDFKGDDLKNETSFKNYNSIVSSSHTSKGGKAVAKQGGFKGERGLKDEGSR